MMMRMVIADYHDGHNYYDDHDDSDAYDDRDGDIFRPKKGNTVAQFMSTRLDGERLAQCSCWCKWCK